jgi:hypothetical protein
MVATGEFGRGIRTAMMNTLRADKGETIDA